MAISEANFSAIHCMEVWLVYTVAICRATVGL